VTHNESLFFIEGDDMRAKILAFAFAAAAAAPVLLADPPENTSDFDFTKINATIKAAMQPVVASSERISKFTYELDPAATDLKNDRYAINMELEGKAPSSDKNFAVKGTVIFDHDPEGREGVLKLNSNLEITTDTLALIRHHAEKSTACAKTASSTGILRVAMSEDCKSAAKLAKVATFDELHQILREHLDSAQKALTDYSADLSLAILAVQGDVSKESLKLELKESEENLKSITDAKLVRTAEGVQLTIANLTLMEMNAHKNIQLDFSAEKTLMKCESSVGFGSFIYLAAKPEILQILKDLETGAEYTVKMTQLEARFWLRLIEDHIAGPAM
jgi:hypothetical protein